MISYRQLKSALKEFYPHIYNDIVNSFRKVDRSFDDIQLLSKLFQVKDYDTKSNYLGAVCLMYWENTKRNHFLKFGTCIAVSNELNKKESNTSVDLSAAWTILKYRPEFKATCQLMVTILDNYKAQMNESSIEMKEVSEAKEIDNQADITDLPLLEFQEVYTNGIKMYHDNRRRSPTAFTPENSESVKAKEKGRIIPRTGISAIW